MVNFLKLQAPINCQSMSQYNLVQCPSEIGAGTRGASLGPQALQINAAEQHLSLLAELDQCFIPAPAVQPYHARQASIAYHQEFTRLYNNIYKHFAPCVGQYDKHLILTGDHSSAAAFFGTLKDQQPDQRWGVLWIDAHGDLHTPYTTPSGNYHGMPLANILGLTNEANAIRKLDQATHDDWQAMLRLGERQLSPKLDPDSVFFIDIRDLEQQEWSLIHHYQIPYTTPAQRQEQGIETVKQQALDFAWQFDALYVSFDVDSLDAALVPGTGTPVPNGLSWQEAEQLLGAVCALPQTKALEVTEINPLKDHANQMAGHINQILSNVIR